MFNLCACNHCDLGENTPRMQRCKIRRARKEHICCECKDTINSGCHYEYYSLLYDEGWGHHITCMACVALRSDMYGPNGCWYFGELFDDFQECYGFRPNDDPSEWEDEDDDD